MKTRNDILSILFHVYTFEGNHNVFLIKLIFLLLMAKRGVCRPWNDPVMVTRFIFIRCV